MGEDRLASVCPFGDGGFEIGRLELCEFGVGDVCDGYRVLRDVVGEAQVEPSTARLVWYTFRCLLADEVEDLDAVALREGCGGGRGPVALQRVGDSSVE